MLYNDVTVVIGLVYTVILFMIVPLVSTLDGMDNAMLEAGYNLGGSRFTVFRRIIVPYAMPGIVAGCIIVFMLTAGSYLTPILLGGKNSAAGSPSRSTTSSSPATIGRPAPRSVCSCLASRRSWCGWGSADGSEPRLDRGEGLKA